MSEINNETIANNVESTVDQVVETVEETVTTPVVETVNETVEETPRKSFFAFFKKDKAGNTEAEEVPVDETTVKKSKYCGLCYCKKKESAPAPAETTEAVAEETAPADGEAVTETAASPVVEEVVAAEEPVAVEEPTPAEVAGAPAVVTEEPVVAEPVPEVARSGVLFKSGKFFKSHMNERHCRLLKNGVFQWSKTDDFTNAHECKVCGETTTVSFMAEGENTPHKYRFEAHCCGNVTTFATDSEEDRDEWVRTIEIVKESVAPVETYAEVVAEEPKTEEAQAASE